MIRVMMVDDHLVVRSGLKRLLEQDGTIEIIAEAENGDLAYQMYGDILPDVLLMDLSMPGMGGLEAAQRIIRRYPVARIIIFSMHEAVSFARQALKAGVLGYVTKNGAANDLVRAVTEVHKGKTFLSAEIAQKMAFQSLVDNDDEPLRSLSAREFEIFRLLTTGTTTEEIAEMLKISQKTVANYHTIIKRKLDVTNPIEMVRIAIKHGLIEG